MPSRRDESEPCYKCNGKRRRSPKGHVYCKDCNVRYRESRRERNRVRDRQYYADHREQARETQRKYFENNRENIRAWAASKERKEQINEWKKKGSEGTRHPDYPVYTAMKSRCYNVNNHKYHSHGGRGVKVCDRWKEEGGFENFKIDMGPRPEPRNLYSIDRYPDRNGDYELDNCRWATAQQQAGNTRKNREYRLGISANEIIWHHNQWMTLKAFSEITGLFLIVVKYRYAMCWDADYILKWEYDNRRYDYKGHFYNLTELSLVTGLDYQKVSNRIKNLKWTAEQLFARV